MQKVLFVAHCVLNTASKVVMFSDEEMAEEEALRRRFLEAAISSGVQLVQLPCPEFSAFGANRWGHVSNQFDNPFFRKHCRELLLPFIDQMREYLAHGERFEILGVLGIDGSPSCGVDYTCFGNWFGNFSDRTDLNEVLNSCSMGHGSGIFMQVLKDLLSEYGITQCVHLHGLFASEPEKCMGLLT
ncbi:MAG: hypothetical protein CVU91_05470 [Firmicutes bacterium HGW-Firmicutes-16]|nr:MAG: hypothetical protein CVU91_05470 [Firmicutes bacterium HGW-Firmicutes-16]